MGGEGEADIRARTEPARRPAPEHTEEIFARNLEKNL